MRDGPGAKVSLGVIVAAHGVRGEVKIRAYTADPAGIAAYGVLADAAGQRRFALRSVRPAKGDIVIAAIDGVNDRDGAEALRGTELYVDRSVLPGLAADEFYRADLVGLAAETGDGRAYGRVVAAHNFGAGDILEIAPAAGGPTEMLPFSRQWVPVVDLARGRIVVVVPDYVDAPSRSRQPDHGQASGAGGE